MSELRPTPIILMAFFCFLFGLFFFSLTANTIFGTNGLLTSDNAMLWFPVGASSILGIALIAVGVGILYYSQWCWKILFFCLMIAISTIASLILIALFLLLVDISLFYKVCQGIHISPMAWFSFLTFFLSGIIVLYYLTRREVVSYFGDMGELVTPF
jgi:hypothetical protein